MELEWNYSEACTGVTAAEKTMDISVELRHIVTKLFINSKDYYDLDLVSKYQRVFETVSFMFEDYRQRFENIMVKRLGDLNLEKQQVEVIVFCSWLSIEVMKALSKEYSRI